MAKHSQKKQETSAHGKQSSCGGRQAVVDLCEITASGLIFWSRQRFDIGAEVQVRIQRSALPDALSTEAVSGHKWVMLKGMVVACPPRRRTDGSTGFEVSLLMDQAIGDGLQIPKICSKMRWCKRALPWMRRFGLN